MKLIKHDKYGLLKQHKDDYVLILRGGGPDETNKSRYDGILIHQNSAKKIRKTLNNAPSANRTMLIGIQDVCQNHVDRNSNLIVVVPTQIGYKKGQKNKGPNASFVRKIINICKQKKINLYLEEWLGCGQAISSWIYGAKIENELNEYDNKYLQHLTKKTKEFVVELIRQREPKLYYSIKYAIEKNTKMDKTTLKNSWKHQKLEEHKWYVEEYWNLVEEVFDLCWEQYYQNV